MKFQSTSFQTVSTAAVLSIVAGLSIQLPASAANLVNNGSFEVTPTKIKDGGWTTYDAIEGWTATDGGKIEIQRGAAGKAYDGKNLLELDSHGYKKDIPVLGVFQDIQTKVGQKYLLSFMFSARPNVKAEDNIFTVLFGDSFSQTIEAGRGGKQTNWMSFTTEVIASNPLTRLQFNSEGERNTFGAYIDSVSLVEASSEAVPEPTTMAGLALAGLGLGAARKAKARRQVQ
jgi:hypothetical protein